MPNWNNSKKNTAEIYFNFVGKKSMGGIFKN
jgi:hypothetical protein